MFNVSKQEFGQFVGQNVTAKVAWRHGRIDRVSAKEQLFLFHSLLNWNLVNDILLSAILYTDISETECYILVHDHSLCIRSSVHNVNLCDHTNCPDSLWIQVPGHLQTIGSCHICIGRDHAKNNCAWVANISVRHCTSDLFNVLVLAGDSNLGDTWQVNQCQVWAGWRKNVEYDGLVNDILWFSTNFISKLFNRNSDFLEIKKFLAWNFLRKYRPWLCSLWNVIESEL